MTAFRYQAIEQGGASAHGVVEAEDRRAALQLLRDRGLFPSTLEVCAPAAESPNLRSTTSVAQREPSSERLGLRPRIRKKDVTNFTLEMAALLGASIPIPQALESLGQQEENPALRRVVLSIASSVRTGS